MAEQVLNKPLSGTEMAKAICFDIERALLRDSQFASHVAYSGFSYRATIEVKAVSGAVEHEFRRPLNGASGTGVPDDAETVTVVAERDKEPPNQVRYDTEQPLTVLRQKDGKTVEEQVSYQGRTERGKPKLPPRRTTEDTIKEGLPAEVK